MKVQGFPKWLVQKFQLRFSFFAVLCCLPAVTPSLWAQSDEVVEPLPGVIYVEFTGAPNFGQTGLSISGVASAFPTVERIVATRSVAPEVLRLQNIHRITFSDDLSPVKAALNISQLPGVVYAEPIYPVQIDDFPVPNDPYFSENGSTRDYLARLRVAEAWDTVKGEDGSVVIAIIDSGVELDHPDLAANLWTNPNEIADNGIDDDGNGYIDDMHGWNFANNSADPSPLGSTGNDYHGTAVAGAAVGVADNGIGVAGTSWNAEFMALNISCGAGSRRLCHDNDGVMYAANNGADIINASYGAFSYSTTRRRIIQAALTLGSLVVAPAGNAGIHMRWHVSYPAGYPETLSVCGTQSASDVNYYNYGYTVDVCAAGRSVWTTGLNDSYRARSGTSFSTPLVSGIAALVKTEFPSYTPIQIREQLRATADNIDAINGMNYTGLLGRGRVNAERAVNDTDAVSVRMTDFSITETTEDGYYEEGEELTITATLHNYLNDISSWSYTWRTDNTNVQLNPGASGNGSSWSSETNQTITATFEWADGIPYKTLVFLEPVVTVNNRVVSGSDAAPIIIKDAQVATHVTSRFRFDITSEGNIGYVEFGNTPENYPGQRGRGFSLRNPSLSSVVYQSGLVMGLSPSQVSSSVLRASGTASVPGGFKQWTNFVPTSDLSFHSVADGLQASSVTLSDENAVNPTNLVITQQSRVDLTDDDDDIALIRYTVQNPTAEAITNVHVGIFSDWDIGGAFYDSNSAIYDSLEQITYTQYNDLGSIIALGLVPLRYGVSTHSLSYSTGSGDLTQPSNLWAGLSGGVHSPTSLLADWAQITGLGPFDIPANSEKVTGFAIVYGSSVSDLRQKAQRARAMYLEWGGPGTPDAPTLTAVSNSLQVSWSPPTSPGALAITGYELRHCNNSGDCSADDSWTIVSSSGTDTTATISGLSNGITYQVQVRALNGAGLGAWSPSATGSPIDPVQRPSAPAAPSITADHLSLGVSWTAPEANGSDITDYDVRYCAVSGSSCGAWQDKSHAGTAVTATITGLTNGTSYQVQVRATNSVGTSDWSASVTGTPGAQAPDVPNAPSITANHLSLGVSWTAPEANGSDITDYDVRYCAVSGSSCGAWQDKSHAGTAVTATITGLTNGTSYQVQVRATNSVGTSDWSASSTGTPGAQAPDVPNAPSITANHLSLGVSWTAPSSNGSDITDYDVRYCAVSGSSCGAWQDKSHAGTAVTATITGLTNGTTYRVQVRATNSAGTSGWSDSGTGVPATQPPDVPSSVTVTTGHQSLGVSWTVPEANGSTITGYTVRHCEGTGTCADADWTSVSVTGTSTTIASLSNGTTYQVQVRATNSVGTSDWSASVTGTPGAQAPDVPNAPSITADHLSLGVSWTAPEANGSDITDYDVRYCAVSGSSCGAWQDKSHTGTAVTATITGLTNGTSYQVQVRATNSVGTSDWSASSTGTPGAQAPDVPNAPSITANHLSLGVSWTAPEANGSDITDYDVRYCAVSGSSCGAWQDKSHAGTAVTATITGLTNGTSYQVQVRATNSVGTSDWSASSTGTPGAQAPDVPNAPSITANHLSLGVSWTAPEANGSDITDYDVRYCAVSGSSCGAWQDKSHAGTAVTATITGLTNGTSYQVQVRATNSVGTSDWSASSTGTPGAQAPDVPNAPSITANHLSLGVSWTAPEANGSDITDYDVRYCAVSGSSCGAWQDKSHAGTAVTATITGLTNGTSYQVQVRATNSVGTSDWSASSTGTPGAQAPDVPNAPSITADHLSLGVSWTAPSSNGSDITDYDVRYCAVSGSSCGAWQDKSHAGTAVTATITGLTNGTSYQVQVRATNSVGTSDWSASSTGTPGAQAPDVPNAPSITADHLSLGVSWTAPEANGSDITDYDVRYCAVSGSSCGAWQDKSHAGTAVTATITGLTNGTSYQVQVRATNSVGTSDWSASSTGTPGAQAPDVPNAPSITANHLSLGVSWTAPEANGSDITDYDVRYCAVSGSSCGAWQDKSHAGTAVTATITGLTNGTTYRVQVRATNSAGTSGWSDSGTGVPATQPPDVPSSVTVTTGHQSLGVSWTVPEANGSTITGYTVRHCEGTGTCADADWTSVSVTGTSTTIASLSNGTTYQVQVRATNSVGTSDWSASSTGTPGAQAPDVPNAPSITADHLSLGVSWTAPSSNGSDITDYDVRYCAVSGSSCGAWQDKSHAGTAVTATITGLTNGTTYRVQVRATNSAGTSGWSDSGTGVPATQPPDVPSSVTVTTGHQSLGVSWTVPEANGSTITGYTVRHCEGTGTCADADWTSVSVTGTSTTIASLSNGTTYQVQVRATNSVGTSDWSASSTGTPGAQAPDVPNAPSITADHLSLGVSWTAPEANGSDITDYDVRYCAVSGSSCGAWQDKSHTGTAVTATITGLTNGTTYRVQVRATNSAGTSGWSDSGTGVPATQPPDVPSSVTVTTGHQSLGVSWTVPEANGSTITGYTVRHCEGTGTCADADWTSVSVTGTSTTIASLSNGTTYQVQVRATNSVGTSDWSASVTGTPGAQAPDVPNAPSITADHLSLGVSWTAPSSNGSDITDYDVRYCAVSGSSCGAWQDKSHTGTAVTATITGLTNGTTYRVQVRATNSAGTSGWSDSGTGVPATQPPDVPSSVTVTTGHQSLGVSWTVPEANGSTITGYTVRHCEGTGTCADADWTSVSVTGTSTTIASLSNGTAYQVQVRATNSVGTSDWSASVTGTPGAQAPDVPNAPSITADHLSLGVSWTAPSSNGSDITDYDVRYCAVSGSSCGAWQDKSHAGTAVTATITGLTNGTTYRVQVRATNSAGTSGWSDSGTGVPATQPPDVPSSVTVTTGHQSLGVSWTVPEANGSTITGYTVRHCEGTGTCADADWTSVSVTGTSTTIASLSNGTTYQVQVRATNSVGTSDWSASVTGTPGAQAPDVPNAPSITADHLSLGVSWTAPSSNGSDITDYDVRYCAVSGSSCGAWQDKSHAGTAVTATITGLTNGTTYRVQVRATNSAGTSGWSDSGTGVPATQPPDVPSSVTVTTGHQSLGVSWTVPEANGSTITGYTVRHCEGTGTCADADWTSVSVTGTSTTIASLSNGTTYQVQVRATNSVGTSDWSASVTGTPGAQAPDVPNAPSITADHLSLGVSWTAPSSNGSDITDYDVRYCAVSGSSCGAWQDKSHTGTAVTATITGLTNGTTYRVQVRATNSAGTSGWSDSGTGVPATQPPDVPSSVTVTTGHQSLGVSWTVPEANGSTITGYTVRHCEGTGTCADADWTSVSVTGTSTTIASLSNGTAYQVQVRATNSVGTSDWSASVTGTPGAQAPDVPNAPSITADHLSLGVSWTAPSSNGSDITDYDVRYCAVSGSSCGAWQDKSHAGTAVTATITGLTNGTTYRVQVRATNSAGTSGWSDSGTGVPATQPPDVPSSVTVTTGHQSLGVSWTVPEANGSTITGYTVRHCEGTGTCADADWTSVSVTGTSTTIASLSNGTTYQVQVRATNSVGTSDWSASVTGTPGAQAPDVPNAPSITADHLSLGVSWTAPSSNGSDITDYDVRYCAVSGSSCGAWQDKSHTGTAVTATITGLTNGTTYRVQVRATNSAGTSGWSDSGTGVPATQPPDVPSSVTVTTGHQSLGVSWTVPEANGSTITGYTVRHCEGTGTCADADWTSVSVTGTSTTIASLSNGTTYQVQVRATNSVGTSDWSASVTGTPGAQAPDVPNAPSITADHLSLGVSWTAPSSNGSDITDYDVRYCAVSGSSCGAWQDKSHAGTAVTATITGLTNGTTYRVQVRATNSAGTSGWSDSGTGVPATQPPDVPSSVTVTTGHQSLGVSWTVPEANGSTITGYTVRHCEGTGTCADADWTSVSVTGTSTTIASLSNGTTYQVQVRATNSVGTSDWSASVTGTPGAQAPDVPNAPSITADHLSLGVSWTAPSSNGSDITDYDVRYCAVSGSSCGAWQDKSHTGTAVTATITGLTNGTTYRVQVRATNSAGTSDWSLPASGVPLAQRPSAPAAPLLTAGTDFVEVSWTAPEANGSPITDYDVRYCAGDASCTAWQDAGVSGTGLTTTLTGLTNGSEYQVQVRATNSAGIGDWSPSSSVVTRTPAAPDAPAAPTLVSGHTLLDVSWTAPPSNGSTITDYDVRYCEGSGTCADADWKDFSFSGTGLSATITGLVNGTPYQVQVRATNGVGTSDWSPSATGTAAAQPPEAPTDLVVTAGSMMLTLAWSPSTEHGAPVTDYEAQYRSGTEDFGSDNVTVSGTSATITELISGVTYDLRVRALSEAGPSPYSMIQGTPEATGVSDQETSRLSVTITGEGNIGHTGVQGDPDSEGVGFVVTTATGERRDVLFEGGLIVAGSAQYVSDAVREGPTAAQQEDFTLQEGTALMVTTPGERTTSEGRVHFTDGQGLNIYQESYIDTASENEGFLILRYIAASDTLDHAHLGIFLDWNVAADGMDAASFDAAQQVGYVMDDATSPTIVVGARLLAVNSHASSLQYTAIDNAAVFEDADGFTQAEKWQLVTGGVVEGTLSGRDVSQLIGAGPCDLRERPAEVVLAIAYGTSVADFLRSADQALNLWNSTVTRTATHETGRLTASITETGNLWYAWERDIAPTTEDGLWAGQGFVTEAGNLVHPSVLSSSGLIVATSAAQVSDVLPQGHDHALQQDFVRVPNTVLLIQSPGNHTTQEGSIRLVDTGAESPIGVTVHQRSFAQENESFLLLRYGIHNTGGSRIENLYAGLAIDWVQDYTGFDAARQVGYVLDADGTVVAGTRLLSQGTLHYQTPTHDALFAQGLTPAMKWQFLTGGVDTQRIEGVDITEWTGTGPVTLEPGDSTVAAFAVVTGTSVEDYLQSADQALSLWQSITVSREAEGGRLDAREWVLSAPYPHPAAMPVNLRFETAEVAHVQLVVYDLLGRRIREITDSPYAQGEHTVTWGGLDETGTQVASGLYMIRMTVKDGNQTIVQSQPIMVIR